MIAAAVILPEEEAPVGLNDSKKTHTPQAGGIGLPNQKNCTSMVHWHFIRRRDFC
ncbi:MAG: hypothetical protein RQM92_10010 [Candidatus Syntrophopropionicum ammoniitolerans]